MEDQQDREGGGREGEQRSLENSALLSQGCPVSLGPDLLPDQLVSPSGGWETHNQAGPRRVWMERVQLCVQ